MLKIATRKSALALAQTTMAAEEILKVNKAAGLDLKYELVPMTTEGDRRLDKSLASFGGKGVFIKELEVALLEGRADIAIHSLKDMPAEVLPEFKLAAVLKREDPRDAFLSRGGMSGVRFMDLPARAKVGTGSIRRMVQLKALRPDLEYVPIRGNIQTRMMKLSELDGIVLAAAGLKRMGLEDQVTEYFSIEQMLPASGQGILAIETLNDTPNVKGASGSESKAYASIEETGIVQKILSRVNHMDTFCISVAEMAYLKALNAGCQFPVASYAEFLPDNNPHAVSGERILTIRGIYFDDESGELRKKKSMMSIPENLLTEASRDEKSFEKLMELTRGLGTRLAEDIMWY